MTTPHALLGYQQRWLADRSEVKFWEKSRRIGASWCQAADSALEAARTNGKDTWYIGYSKDMAMEFIRDVGFWAKIYNFAATESEEIVIEDEDKDIIAFRVVFASGFRVTALSSRPSNLRGKKGIVVIDEAAFHPDLDGLLKAALALIIWGGRVVVLSTHFGDTNPFNELVQDIRAKKAPYSLFRTTFEEACREGLFARICLATGKTFSEANEKEWKQKIYDIYRSNADEELGCIPSGGNGTYFTRALVEKCMEAGIPIVRYRLPDSFVSKPELEREQIVNDWFDLHIEPLIKAMNPNLRSYFGMDFGRSGDLSVFEPLVEDQCLKHRVPFLLEMRNIPFTTQKLIVFRIVPNLPRFMAGAMDARGNGQYLAEVCMQAPWGGGRIAQVMPTQEWYRENMPQYKEAMEDGNVVIPKDADVLNDHRMVVMEKGVPKVPDDKHSKGADGGQRHGDSAVSGCLAWFARNMEVGPIEFQTVGEVRESFNLSDFTG